MSANQSITTPSPDSYFHLGTLTLESRTAGEIEIPVDLVAACPCCSGLVPEIEIKPSAWFVGRDVKLSFPTPGYALAGENMWVRVEDHEGNELTGTLLSHPCFSDIEHGDGVMFHRDAIMAVEEAIIEA